MDNKPRLKDRLARIFRPPALLRSSAAAVGSSRSLSAGESTRSFTTAADIAHEPIFISRSRAGEADELHFALLQRSLSLDHRSRRNLCGGCRPTAAGAAASPAVQGKEKKESRKNERSDFYENGELEGDGKTCLPVSPSFESPKSSHLFYYWIKEAESKKKTTTKKKKQRQRSRSNRYQLSISSSFGEEGFGFFSSEETDTFFSSRSFSSDSSEFYRRPSPKTRKGSKKTETRNKKKHDESSDFSSRRRRPAAARRRDGFTNGFQPMISVSFSEQNEAEKNRREGFPVLKKSCDPYSDFRSSMVEMIVERQIFGAQGLERLLRSYLSLNSPEIHSAIFRAFADISQVLFSY